MKFLLALSLLITTNVFAQIQTLQEILCYEPAEQSGHGKLTFLIAEGEIPQGPPFILLFWPFKIQGQLVPKDGCLVKVGSELSEPETLKFCRGEGQRINDLVPVEVEAGYREETVYCDKKIKKWFGEIEPI